MGPGSAGSNGESTGISPTNSTGNSAGTNSAPPRPGAAAATGSAPSQPTADRSRLSANSRPNLGRTVSGEGQVEVSNAVPEKVAATTNSPGGRAAGRIVDDSTMSPFDRELAAVLRDVILGTYLLLLLLLLLFVAYRIWRWHQERERKTSGRTSGRRR